MKVLFKIMFLTGLMSPLCGMNVQHVIEDSSLHYLRELDTYSLQQLEEIKAPIFYSVQQFNRLSKEQLNKLRSNKELGHVRALALVKEAIETLKVPHEYVTAVSFGKSLPYEKYVGDAPDHTAGAMYAHPAGIIYFQDDWKWLDPVDVYHIYHEVGHAKDLAVRTEKGEKGVRLVKYSTLAEALCIVGAVAAKKMSLKEAAFVLPMSYALTTLTGFAVISPMYWKTRSERNEKIADQYAFLGLIERKHFSAINEILIYWESHILSKGKIAASQETFGGHDSNLKEHNNQVRFLKTQGYAVTFCTLSTQGKILKRVSTITNTKGQIVSRIFYELNMDTGDLYYGGDEEIC